MWTNPDHLPSVRYPPAKGHLNHANQRATLPRPSTPPPPTPAATDRF